MPLIRRVIFSALRKMESFGAKYQGKGWGAATVSQEVDLASQFVKDPKLIIDIGANIGKYTVQLLEKFPTAQIHLFEPSAANFGVLNEQFGSNKNVVINQAAVAEMDGNATLYSEASGSSLSSLTQRRLQHMGIEFDKAEQVKTVRFENYWHAALSNRPIDLVKIDVEGHELQVLNGMGEAVTKTKVIQFEFGGCNIDTRTYFQDFWYFFKDHSFDIYRITPLGLDKLWFYRESDESFTATNFLAVNHNF